MHHITPEEKLAALKQYLLFNGVFSGFSAFFMILGSRFLTDTFGLQQPMVFAFLGINLFIFAGFVLYVAYMDTKNKLFVYAIIFLDLLWVLVSIVLVTLKPIYMTSEAYATITVVALIVAYLAYGQIKNVVVTE